MADINIQRKKSSPSPWLLVLLAVLVLGAVAYYLLRHDAPEPTAPAVPATEAPAADTLTGAETGPRPATEPTLGPAEEPEETAATSTSLQQLASSSPAVPGYGRRGLQQLTTVLLSLADRDDLRQPDIISRRDDLTSATSRLQTANSSLRAGYLAATALMQAIQQQRYPELEAEISQLIAEAADLTGRDATPAEQQALQTYLTHAARVVQALEQPPVG